MATTTDWHRLQSLFDQAARLPASERHAFLRRGCAGDSALYDRLQRLLESDDRQGLLDAPMHSPAASLDQTLVGRQIGRYKLVRLIASGGMGTVYEAQQDHPRRMVALKLMHRSAGSRSLLRRFQAEADILGRLQHPAIAQIHDAGVVESDDGAQPYFAMELVDGVTIGEYAATRDLGTRQRLALLEKVCHGVQHAHAHGVIHRDLKPANILIDSNGEPKILDFGIARITAADGAAATTLRTDVGQLLGTLPYMSPEQVAGDPAHIDQRCDVYALGVIAYELLTGRLPHDCSSSSIPQIIRAIREDEPTPLSSVNRVFRGDLDTIIAKALEKDPARRYQSPKDLAHDIHRYLNDQPVLARHPSAAYQLRKFARRNKILVASTIAVLLSLIIGFVGTSIGLIRARLAAREQARQTLRANAAELHARAQLQQTIQLLTEMTLAFENLSDLPGATMTRYLLAQRTVDALPRDDGEDFGELSQMAGYAYQRMGEVQLAMGRVGDALASFRTALEVRAADADRTSGDSDPMRALAVGHWKVAEALVALGRHAEARDHLNASFDLLRELERMNALPMQDHYFGAAHRRMADVLAQLELPADALHAYEQAIEHYDRILAEVPDNTPSKQGRAMALRGIGELLLSQGDPRAAIARIDENLAILDRMAEESGPANVFARTHSALGLIALARARAELGDRDGAVDAARRASEIARHLAQADRMNHESQHLEARGAAAWGHALASSDPDAARVLLVQALERLQELHRAQPDNALVLNDLAVVRQLLDASAPTGTAPSH